MTLLYAALLGVIQGLTEFLPVSSSAHLILARAFFGWDAEQFGMAFDVACHVGTLIAVLVYFRAEILAMIRAIPRVGTLAGPRPDPAAWMALLIVIGTVPAVVVGLLAGDLIEQHLRRPAVTAVTLARRGRSGSSPWSASGRSAGCRRRSGFGTRSSSGARRQPPWSPGCRGRARPSPRR